MLLALPAAASAGYLKAREDYILPRGQFVGDDLYAASRNVTVAGDVAGDLLAAGSNVYVSGLVQGDAVVSGGSVNVSGSVRDDVRAAGGKVLISGPVGDDVAAAGGQIHLLSGSVVNGNVYAAGKRITIDGNVNGVLNVTGGEVVINGFIGRDANIKAGRVTLGERAVITGNFSYTAERAAQVMQGARIGGQTRFTQSTRGLPAEGDLITTPLKLFFKGAAASFYVVSFLMYFAGALVLVWLLRSHARGLLDRTAADPGRALLVGLIVAVVAPVALVMVMFSVIGLPLALLFMGVYLLWFGLASFFAPVLLGSWLDKVLFKRSRYELNWKTVLLGAVALSLLGLVPFLGGLAGLALTLTAFGGLARTWYKYVWLNR